MKPDGGPAFPSHVATTKHDGMTLRDYFAAAALTGIQQWDALLNPKSPRFGKPGAGEDMAALAYEIADAMIAKRDE